MNRALAIAVGATGAGGVLYLALDWLFGSGEGEPAPPTALSETPSSALSGASGIDPTPDEVEALARVIASEAGRGTRTEQKAIAWTVRNRFRGGSIYSGKGKNGGEYPWREQRGSNPPFASSKDATDATRALAREVLTADQLQDPTGGATSFFEPKLQDVLAEAGALARAGETGSRVIDGVKLSDITRFKAYKKSADDVRKSWSPGSAHYATAGRFEFWGSASALAKRGGATVVIAGEAEVAEKFKGQTATGLRLVPRAEEIRKFAIAPRGLLALGRRA